MPALKFGLAVMGLGKPYFSLSRPQSRTASPDFLDANSAAIIRSQRFFWKRALITSCTRLEEIAPFGAGFFSEPRCPFNFLRASNIAHCGGVRDRRFAFRK